LNKIYTYFLNIRFDIQGQGKTKCQCHLGQILDGNVTFLHWNTLVFMADFIQMGRLC